jgi:hypothetical protein
MSNMAVIIHAVKHYLKAWFARPNVVLCQMSKWLSANKLAPNLENTNIIKFIMNNSPQHTSVLVIEENM